MWYNFNTLRSGSSVLQKETTHQFLPHIMNPVEDSLQVKTSRGKDQVVSKSLSDCSILYSFSDPAVFLDFALDYILAGVEASTGSFFVWDEYAKELVLKTSRGLGRERIQDTRIKLRQGVAGWVAERGFPVLVKDIRTDGRFSQFEKRSDYQTFSFLSLPLICSNKLVGLINISERESKAPFSEEDLSLAQKLAAHVAVAYEKVKTESRLRKENQELTQTVQDLKNVLKQQEPLVSIGKLSSHLAHEMTNPIDAIRRFVNLALDQVGQESMAREYLLKAKKGIRRSLQVIRGMLELSGTASRVRIRQSELHNLIDQAISSFAQDPTYAKVAIQKAFCDKSFFVEDCGLNTVFQNLIQNAHHAMNGSGTIQIGTKAENHHAVITVKDSGHGISDQVKNRIFEPFFTTKQNGDGTGIGLVICKEIIQRCGGQICFESVENVGTTFIITLPCRN